MIHHIKKLTDENHDHLIRCRKASEKSQHPFMIKKIPENENIGNTPQYNKGHI